MPSRTAPAPSTPSSVPSSMPGHAMRLTTPGFGVYVHWPFCAQKCPYCDFNSHVRFGGIDEARFLAAFQRELEHAAALTGPRTVTSIFFGGGTPSLMPPETVAAHSRSHRRAVERRSFRRDHARGQSRQRRGGPLPRLSRGGRQPRVARRAVAARRRAQVAGAHPFGRRGEGGSRHRARQLRPLLLRPHLCASRADGGGVAGASWARRWRSPAAPVALSAHDRAGDAVRRAACRRQARRCRTRTRRSASTRRRRS